MVDYKLDEEEDDDSYEDLIKEQRHKEMITAIRSLSDNMARNKLNATEITEAISRSIQSISDKINIPTPQVRVDNKAIAQELSQLKSLLEDINENMNKPEEPCCYEFDFQRNGYGLIEKIIVNKK